MGEKFNSGYGGYICDWCRKLLWAGSLGSIHPDKRKFIYSTQAEDVVEREDLFFCSEECASHLKEAQDGENSPSLG